MSYQRPQVPLPQYDPDTVSALSSPSCQERAGQGIRLRMDMQSYIASLVLVGFLAMAAVPLLLLKTYRSSNCCPGVKPHSLVVNSTGEYPTALSKQDTAYVEAREALLKGEFLTAKAKFGKYIMRWPQDEAGLIRFARTVRGIAEDNKRVNRSDYQNARDAVMIYRRLCDALPNASVMPENRKHAIQEELNALRASFPAIRWQVAESNMKILF